MHKASKYYFFQFEIHKDKIDRVIADLESVERSEINGNVLFFFISA